MGLEPATYGLQNHCSAIELHQQGRAARTAILLGLFNPCQWLREAVAHQASQEDALLAKKLNQSSCWGWKVSLV